MVAQPGITELVLITPANHPTYRELVAPLAEACWPEFMLHDAVADRLWGALFERFGDYQFGLLDPLTGRAAAMGNSVPLRWEAPLEELPERGWDWAMEQAVRDHQAGNQPNIQCAIQVAIDPAYRGRSVSTRMVQAMRAVAISKGFSQLIAPVRPSQKADYPLSNIDRYIEWKTEQGLAFDAWLRVHQRAGAKIIKVCHESMTISGSADDWRSWTGISFPETGQYYVPGALNPVEADLKAGTVTYIEPNVWMVHALEG
ncbi:MAG: GNAT family N-acetyltransferase [Anaerolineae bacterium]